MSNVKLSLAAFIIGIAASTAAPAQQMLLAAPEPQPGHISGTVTDDNGDIIPGATVVLEVAAREQETAVANDNGGFAFDNVSAGSPVEVRIHAPGFADWESSPMTLNPGQFALVTDIKLKFLAVETSITVTASSEEIATQQVRLEEQQRVLGFIPNFYVVYDRDAAPLTPKLKFELATKVMLDPITFAGTAFLAGANQSANYPDYPQGAKGYGQRFGAIYANDLTDIMVGGAILPSVLHQDPRYFYQGTGTTKSRLVHALSSPIIAHGDNGRLQPNYSSLGGYLASGAIANAYYPETNRGAGLVFNTFAVDLSANVANAVIQEFVLRRFTPSMRNR
jgi:Carboxypeptidase regulatory-like domain